MKTLKVEGGLLRGISDALKDLMQNRLPLLTAVALGEIKGALGKLLDPFNDEINKLVTEFGTDGTVNQSKMSKKKWADFLKAAKPYEEEVLSLKIEPITMNELQRGTKPMEVLPDSIVLLREVGIVVDGAATAPKRNRKTK